MLLNSPRQNDLHQFTSNQRRNSGIANIYIFFLKTFPLGHVERGWLNSFVTHYALYSDRNVEIFTAPPQKFVQNHVATARTMYKRCMID